MPAPIDAACPACQKALKVPAELAGKKIRCKNCQTVFSVGGAEPPPAAPIALKEEPPAAPPPPNKPYSFADDEEENDNPYGVTADDLDVARCPFCAKELDPPDAKICKHCGYDMEKRRRHERVAVYEPTTGEYVAHLAPGVAAVIGALCSLAFVILSFIKMRSWMRGSMLDAEAKDQVTQKETFYIPPYCFNLWIGLVGAVVIYALGRFAYKRLVVDWKPEEKKYEDDDD